MATKLLAAAVLLCSTAYAASNSSRLVGTVNVRGNISIDGNPVSSDGTLFDGSIIETQQASATLNLGSHSTVVMAPGTRGVAHDGYVSLEQGKIDVHPDCGFVVEAGQIRITPDSPDAHGLLDTSGSSISMTVEHGEFLVLDQQGRLLGTLHSGNSQSFGLSQTQSAGEATYVGTLNILDNHRLLTLLPPDADVSYELHGGRDSSRLHGSLVQVNGTVDRNASAILAQSKAVVASTRESGVCTNRAIAYPWLVGSAAAAAAAGTAAAIIVNQPQTPASR